MAHSTPKCNTFEASVIVKLVVTPQQRHLGEDKILLKKRDMLYQAAKQVNPTRWSGKTRNWARKESFTLNPEREKKQYKFNLGVTTSLTITAY